MSTAPSLRELQHRLEGLWSLGGSPDLERHLSAAAAELPIGGDHRLGAAERLAIYARMIFVRIRDAIAEDFPATVAALGEEAWEPLVRRYLDAHPTDHHDLRLAGRRLPGFLRTEAPTWIADLAELELALMEAFTAADAPVLDLGTVAALPADAWPELLIKPIPSLRTVRPATPSDTIRRRLLDGDPPGPTSEAGSPIRVWRRELRVFQRRIDEFERKALSVAAPGISFAELCEWIEHQGSHEDPATTAVSLLRSWLTDQLLTALP